jgi:bis(5'-nucleosyl)-tetraphosphatase (symmetrical)
LCAADARTSKPEKRAVPSLRVSRRLSWRAVRRIFIGDIQGCRAELEQLLELVRFDPAVDRLQPVGDIVNRGPDSLGALRLLRQLDAQSVLGNHDVHLLRVAAGRRALRASDTLGPLLASDVRAPLLAWLAAQPFLRVHADLYCVHAALHPAWRDPVAELAGLGALDEDPRIDFATRARHCDARGERPPSDDEPCTPPQRPWFEYYRRAEHGGRRVVFGHWAARGLVVNAEVIGLDSGCVWGGALSAWIAEEDRIVAVPAQRAWAVIGSD